MTKIIHLRFSPCLSILTYPSCVCEACATQSYRDLTTAQGLVITSILPLACQQTKTSPFEEFFPPFVLFVRFLFRLVGHLRFLRSSSAPVKSLCL
jgi:hypothetical protein